MNDATGSIKLDINFLITSEYLFCARQTWAGIVCTMIARTLSRITLVDLVVALATAGMLIALIAV
jgi:hypothetical protein